MKEFELILILTSISIIHGKIEDTILENVVDYFSKCNDINIESILVVSNQFECLKDSLGHCQNIWEASFLQNKTVSYLYLENDLNTLQIILQKSKSTLIIVVNGHLTNAFEKILISTPISYFIDNSWLWIFDYFDDGNHVLEDSMRHLVSVGKTGLNSQFYILLNIESNFKLFEVYQPCVEQPPLKHQLIEFSST